MIRRIGLVLVIALVFTAGARYVSASTTAALSKVARGQYVVEGFGCSDCHTPLRKGQNGPEPLPGIFLAGHPAAMKLSAPQRSGGPWLWSGAATNTAFAGPWGVSFARSLTPDEMTGIGAWTEDMFVRAMKTGRPMGSGRPILPPMPWRALAHLTEDDLSAVYAYLRTVPAVQNQIPDPLPPQ
jgi:mono/diheme cytochrome c family protein